MKRALSVFILLVIVSIVHAQELRPSLRLGAGYSRDFHGLGGVTGSAEIIQPVGYNFEIGAGVKRVQMQGFPRTGSIKEITKATTFDLNVYFLPVAAEQHQIRVGVGYSFTIYKVRRAFPVMEEGGQKVASWSVQDQKGNGRGFGFSAEYQYLLPQSNLSLGLRASIFKAYDGVTYIGPFAAFAL